MNPHRIRLGRPWQCEPSPRGTLWRRPFNRPTGLGPRDRVWLVVAQSAGAGVVTLNGHLLGRVAGDESTARFDVTEQLELHNKLMLEMAGASASPEDQPPGEVALEIETLS